MLGKSGAVIWYFVLYVQFGLAISDHITASLRHALCYLSFFMQCGVMPTTDCDCIIENAFSYRNNNNNIMVILTDTFAQHTPACTDCVEMLDECYVWYSYEGKESALFKRKT